MSNRENAIAKRLERWGREFAAGKKIRSLEAISLCLQFDQPAPAWAIAHFCSSVANYTNANAVTLDSAFQVARPKHWRQTKEKGRSRSGLLANIKVGALTKRGHCEKGMSVENAVAEVAEELSMDVSTVERWYYDEEINEELGVPQKDRKV
jgi:hypothetical protein